MFPGSSVPILKSLASLEVSHFPGVSRAYPRSVRGHAWFMTVGFGVFDVRNVVCMSPGGIVTILKSQASLEEISPLQCFSVLLPRSL